MSSFSFRGFKRHSYVLIFAPASNYYSSEAKKWIRLTVNPGDKSRWKPGVNISHITSFTLEPWGLCRVPFMTVGGSRGATALLGVPSSSCTQMSTNSIMTRLHLAAALFIPPTRLLLMIFWAGVQHAARIPSHINPKTSCHLRVYAAHDPSQLLGHMQAQSISRNIRRVRSGGLPCLPLFVYLSLLAVLIDF